MLIDTYTMIVPESGTFSEYEQFYLMYGSIIRNSIITWKLLDEAKEKLPNIYIEMLQNIRQHEKSLPSNFTLIGLGYEPGKRKNYEKSISNSDIDEIKQYFGNDVSAFIEYVTNKQQFLNLYTAFEGTMRTYLRRAYQIDACKQEQLVTKLLEKENGFLSSFSNLCNCSFSEDQFKKFWQYYTLIRNLYSHSAGYMGQKFLDTINGIKPCLTTFVENDNSLQIELSLFLKEDHDLFQFAYCKALNKGKLFTISEYNLRFFRNLIVHIWETLYVSKVCTVNVKRNFSFTKNTFEFRLCSGSKEYVVLQEKEQNITQNNPCFNVSGYMCPQCRDLGILLYKAKFNPHIDISELIYGKKDSSYMARNVFTCPGCHSFYFPKYQEELKLNNGFNLLNLNEIEYENLLNMFESKADISYGYRF